MKLIAFCLFNFSLFIQFNLRVGQTFPLTLFESTSKSYYPMSVDRGCSKTFLGLFGVFLSSTSSTRSFWTFQNLCCFLLLDHWISRLNICSSQYFHGTILALQICESFMQQFKVFFGSQIIKFDSNWESAFRNSGEKTIFLYFKKKINTFQIYNRCSPLQIMELGFFTIMQNLHDWLLFVESDSIPVYFNWF